MFGGGGSSTNPSSSGGKTDGASISSSDSNASTLVEKADAKAVSKSPSPGESSERATTVSTGSPIPAKSSDQAASGEKRAGNGSPPTTTGSADQKKRRSAGVSSKASSLLATARSSLNFSGAVGRSGSDLGTGANQTPLQKLGKQDPALAVPQGQHNNSAGESLPGPRSTFRVGVWEDRNKKCRRTMEDTHAFLYNFLHTPAPSVGSDGKNKNSAKKEEREKTDKEDATASQDMLETDNGYFAVFDGHAGTFAADWCGKKLHIILEEIIRKNPNVPIPELLDQTFTTVDAQLEKLPLKNSGCTAAIAMLRWEDRVPSHQSATGSQSLAPAVAEDAKDTKSPESSGSAPEVASVAKLKPAASRQRVLYTANVGDARIILCRSGKALRLSYDHKGSDDNEGKRIANAGGLILNNRVNGVLAVTRALGDTYMKELVTGHPYTTETVIQPEVDEFLIIACDGLWDVCSDQEAVDLVREIQDPTAGAKLLVDHALAHFSTDNLSCMIVRFDKGAILANKEHGIGVEGDQSGVAGKVSEADKIVRSTKQKIADGDVPPIGVSASNSGRGHDPSISAEENESAFVPTTIDGSVEEEPSSASEESPETTPEGSVSTAESEAPEQSSKTVP